jgi:hypothetical protein
MPLQRRNHGPTFVTGFLPLPVRNPPDSCTSAAGQSCSCGMWKEFVATEIICSVAPALSSAAITLGCSLWPAIRIPLWRHEGAQGARILLRVSQPWPMTRGRASQCCGCSNWALRRS